MAKISTKSSNLKSIADRIVVSPNTEVVADLKFKRKQDFRKFLKWVDSSSRALKRIEIPSKRELKKIVKDSKGSGGFPWGKLLLGAGVLGAGILGVKAAGGFGGDGEGGEGGDKKSPLEKKISTATDFSGRIPKKIKIPSVKVSKKIKVPDKPKPKPKFKSNTLKNFQKGTKPKVTNIGKGVKVIRPGGGPPIGFETGKGKFSSTPAKAPDVPKKLETKTKITTKTLKPRTISLDGVKKAKWWQVGKKAKNLVKSVPRGVVQTAGKLLVVADAAMTTTNRLQEGQTVKQSVVGGVSEAAGSWAGFAPGMKIGAAVTAKAASPLILAPIPGARVLYAGSILFGGIAGGFVGSKIGRSMFGGLADKFTGVQKKMETIDKKKSPKEKKKELDTVVGKEKESSIDVPMPVITNSQEAEAQQTQFVPIPMGGGGNSTSFSDPESRPMSDGVNSSWETFLLNRL